MKRIVILVALAAAGIALATTWPRLNDVETGRTPEYPDLQPRSYAASPEAVAKAATQAVSSLARWTFVGEGHGPGGAEVRAVHRTRGWGFEDEVTIRIRREGGQTRVSIRSRSKQGKWDFGQNARNVRELEAALDGALRGPPAAHPD